MTSPIVDDVIWSILAQLMDIGQTGASGARVERRVENRCRRDDERAAIQRHLAAESNVLDQIQQQKFAAYAVALVKSSTHNLLTHQPPSRVVNGNWAAWSSWGICSASCGGGTRNRERTCSDPVPQNGGQLCSGSNQQIDNCNIEPCSGEAFRRYNDVIERYLFVVNGNWGSWGSWSECSRTCSGGQMNRYRSCSAPPPRFGGRFCPGSDSEMRGCGLVQCPGTCTSN